MKKAILIVLIFTLNINSFAQNPDIVTQDKTEIVKRNYLGFTPTFILMGMYGLVYSRALNENNLITGVGGYTNFDLSPIPFLHNEDWIYQNVYFGINYTIFPFSEEIFPHGFYFGFDYVPSIGFWEDRETGETATELGNSFDVLVGYSWIFNDKIKLSTDIFLNVNAPGITLKGDPPSDDLTILPFFDINIGFVF